MRDVVFVWEDHEGKVRVTYPNWKAKKPSETDDQFLERVARKLPKPLAMRPEALPKDRSQRNSWRLKDGKVIIQP